MTASQEKISQPAADAGNSGQPESPQIEVLPPEIPRRERLREPASLLHWLKWGDFLIVILIGGLAVILLLAVPRLTDQTGSSAVLTLDGQVILEITAEQLAESGARSLMANGYHYLITWEEGRIRFTEADCPDKVCVRTGWISWTGEIAACAPGHLILKIIGGKGQSSLTTREVDVIIK